MQTLNFNDDVVLANGDHKKLIELSSGTTPAVQSVNGYTGAVVLKAADVSAYTKTQTENALAKKQNTLSTDGTISLVNDVLSSNYVFDFSDSSHLATIAIAKGAVSGSTQVYFESAFENEPCVIACLVGNWDRYAGATLSVSSIDVEGFQLNIKLTEAKTADASFTIRWFALANK